MNGGIHRRLALSRKMPSVDRVIDREGGIVDRAKDGVVIWKDLVRVE